MSTVLFCVVDDIDVYLVCVVCVIWCWCVLLCFFFQAEDGIRDLVRSRGLGDVYKRQVGDGGLSAASSIRGTRSRGIHLVTEGRHHAP